MGLFFGFISAVILAVILAAVLPALVAAARRAAKKARFVIPAVAAGVSLAAAVVIAAFTATQIYSSENPPPGAANALRKKPEAAAMPDDYDLPVEEVPEFSPDVLGIRNSKFEAMPTLASQNEVTEFVLYNFLNNRFEFEMYLTARLAPDEGAGYAVLNNACETAMTYYLFSAYEPIDMYTRAPDENEKAFARIYVVYTNPEYDLEAKAEALEFVLKNSVPANGLQDFENEKEYAGMIHDFIAKKITYSPIGYDPQSMLPMNNYEACQEAYNTLAADGNTAVCGGYARAFALIAQYAGINAAWVLGNETETESHAWNVVYPCDGSEPVLVDVTWDDSESDDSTGQEYVSDKYFYIPLSEECEHTAADSFAEFLCYINNKYCKAAAA